MCVEENMLTNFCAQIDNLHTIGKMDNKLSFPFSYNRDGLEQAVENLNNNFGGQEQVVSFVLFTNAGLDPWIGHGVSEYHLEDGAVIFIYCESYLTQFVCYSF